MTIHIENLVFETIIGVLAFERLKAQKVIVNAKIDYNYTDSNYLDYAELITLIENNMHTNKYLLLETAIEKVSQELLKKYTSIQRLELKITKPTIIPNAKVSLSKSFNQEN